MTSRRPTLELLDPALVDRVLDEALELLATLGIRVQDDEAIGLLRGAGATVEDGVARIPERLVRDALASAPGSFDVFGRDGEPALRYGQGMVHFDPGSSGVHVLDPETLEHRTSEADDLVRLIKVAEQLAAYDAQSTAVVCNDVPAQIGDLYRLLLVLLYSDKPIVTGAFSATGSNAMIDILAIDAGGHDALRTRPRAVFDVCPTPPLTWSSFGAANLVALARAGVPAEIVSMPLAGAAAPVTLIGSIVQHAAECLSGIVIHQLAAPGAPVVWGGAPTILDMRTGAAPMGAIETAMIDAGYAQVGRSLGLPTHCYLGATDAKVVDAQAGMESSVGGLVGALAGVDLISGAGMLDFLLCQSAEKLVVDAEWIGMARRLRRGIETPTESLAVEMFTRAGLEGHFLELADTRRLFRGEQHLPSAVVDRASHRAWLDDGGLDAFGRARRRVDELLASYRRPSIAPEAEAAIIDRVRREGAAVGLAGLPGLPG
jgi:trimethylamine---corrinoid protein Co-methyltransferase